MGVDASELLVPFAGAIQASFSVLLTIAFGVIAAQCNLLSTNAAKEVSKLCVRMFLPALLIFKIGSNLHQGTAVRYIPVLSMEFTLEVIVVLTILIMPSLVDILHTPLCPPWTRPHPRVQAPELGNTSNCFQQHDQSTTATYRVSEADPDPRCHPRRRRLGGRRTRPSRIVLPDQCHGQQFAYVCIGPTTPQAW
jgi:hypothetical protein